MKRGVIDEVREAGGEVFGITSEPHALAAEAKEAWDLNFPTTPFSPQTDAYYFFSLLCFDFHKIA